MNKKFTILFDLDGTLIDSTKAILDGFRTAFIVHKKAPPNDTVITNLIGYPLSEIFSRLEVGDDELQSYIRAYKSRYLEIYLSQTSLLPGAKEAIKMAYEFACLGIVTTKSSDVLPQLLSHLGVLEFFDAIVGFNDVKQPKPNAEPINLALARLNRQKKGAFMIGDTPLDILAAKNAGIGALALSCGYASKSELEKYTNLIFLNPLEAVKYLKNLN